MHVTRAVTIGAIAVGILGLVLATKSPGSSHSFPGRNGKIAYVVRVPQFGDADICVMNADGSGRIRMTHGPTHDAWPAWSADGRRLAFARYTAWEPHADSWIYVADSARRSLKRVPGNAEAPRAWQVAWSPDGARIVYSDAGEIMVAAPNGSDAVRIASGHGPDWSPDGRRIAYGEAGGISVINADGTDARRITQGADFAPSWSSDGTRIAFSRLTSSPPSMHIYIVGADGSDLHASRTAEVTRTRTPHGPRTERRSRSPAATRSPAISG